MFILRIILACAYGYSSGLLILFPSAGLSVFFAVTIIPLCFRTQVVNFLLKLCKFLAKRYFFVLEPSDFVVAMFYFGR